MTQSQREKLTRRMAPARMEIRGRITDYGQRMVR
jgi:hypothetical protein